MVMLRVGIRVGSEGRLIAEIQTNVIEVNSQSFRIMMSLTKLAYRMTTSLASSDCTNGSEDFDYSDLCSG